MFFTVAGDGIILSVNEVGAKQLGYRADELAGTNVLNIFHPDDKNCVTESLKRVLHSESLQDKWEFRKLHKNGSVIWVREVVNVIFDNQNKPIFLVVCENINEEKATEAALKKKAEDLAAVNKDLKQIAFAAAHDLKQPLRVVMGAIQIFSNKFDEQLGEDDKSLIHLGENGIRKMNRLLDDLLLYTGLGSYSISPKPFSLEEAYNEAVCTLAPLLREKSVNIYKNNELGNCYGDFRLITNLFIHLFDNAIKFSKGENPTIELIVPDENDDSFSFAVKDFGIGIDNEYHDYIFGIFKKLHSEEDFIGNGIGLAYCKKVTDIHRGTISIESIPNEGTTVYIKLSSDNLENFGNFNRSV